MTEDQTASTQAGDRIGSRGTWTVTAFGLSSLCLVIVAFIMSSSPRPDSELWLFVESAETQLRLASVKCDAAFNVQPMSVHTSPLSDAGRMQAWSPGAVVTADEGVAAVAVRLSDGTEALDRPVSWRVELSGDGVSATLEFRTSPTADEGLVKTRLTAGDKQLGEVHLRFLLIRDALADPLPATSATWLHSLSSVLFAGHRGMGVDPAPWPENSLDAFRAAHAAGADMVELDVQLSKDGRLAIHHDLHTPAGRLLRETDWAELTRELANVTDLPAVLQSVSPQLAVDVEVKYPNTQVDNHLESGHSLLSMLTADADGCPLSRLFSKDELASSVLACVVPEASRRRLLLSTFSPDLALVLARKIPAAVRPRLPVVQLTRGEHHPSIGSAKAHADPRLASVAAAAGWARAAGLDGVAAFARSLMEAGGERLFDRRTLPLLVWGPDMNQEEVLVRMKTEGRASVLIFDHIDRLLAKVRG